MNWKYNDKTQRVASRTLANGSMQSRLATAIDPGDTIDPAEPYASSLAEARTKRKSELKVEAKPLLIQARDDLANSDAQINTLRNNLRSEFQTASTILSGINIMDDIENHSVIWSTIP